MSDVDISHTFPRQLHSLAFTGDKCVAFADPVQQTGWLIDLKIASPFVVTGKEHKHRKVVISGTRPCSFTPETRNIIVSKAPDQRYVLKTGNGKRESLKMVSEFSIVGIIVLGLSVSMIRLKIVLGDGPDDFVDVLPSFKLKWPQKYANQGVGIRIIVQETPQVLFTLADIQGEADFHLLKLNKLFIGPVSHKGFDLRPLSSHLIKPLSSLASNAFKG